MIRSSNIDQLFAQKVANDRPEADGWMPLPELAHGLWQQRGLMAGVFLGVFALGAGVAMMAPTTYPAYSSVLVRLGDENVYQPTVGDAGKGAVASQPEQLMKAEIEILNSAALRERVLTKTGLDRLDPELGAKYKAIKGSSEAAKQERRKIMGTAVAIFSSGVKITPAPNTSVIRLSYAHEDSQFAADALNRLIDEYLAYRREVLQGVSAPLIAAQRRGFEERLVDAQGELETFLTTNGIGDFEGEKKANIDAYAETLDQYYKVQSDRRQAEARRDSLAARLGEVSPQVNLYIDENTNDKLLAMKVERADLVARFTLDSPQVRNVDERIAQLQQLIASGQTQGQGPKRVGINSVHDTLQTDQLQAQAEAYSLAQREAMLSQQLTKLSERQLFLQSLAPRYQQLIREKDVLESNAKAFAEREEETRASREISEKVTDNIRIIERPIPSVKGKSVRLPVLALSFILAAATALMAGALRVLSTAPRIVRAASGRAGFVQDLPVLATLPMKVRAR
jgi:uncharacterized protein involved in exopolysaccharide biosynthesis